LPPLEWVEPSRPSLKGRHHLVPLLTSPEANWPAAAAPAAGLLRLDPPQTNEPAEVPSLLAVFSGGQLRPQLSDRDRLVVGEARQVEPTPSTVGSVRHV
jgi:hypothetical protein